MQLDLEKLNGMSVGEIEPIVGSFLGDVWNGVKKVAKSPITAAVVGGVALVFPPVGVPASVALAAANVTIRATEAKNVGAAVKSAITDGSKVALANTKDPAAIAAIHATQTVINTAVLAKKGNPQAAAAMKTLAIAASSKNAGPQFASVMNAAAAAAQKSGAVAAGKSMAASAAAAGRATAKRAPAVAKAAPLPVPPGWLRSVEGSYKRA